MINEGVCSRTESVCPECLKVIAAERRVQGDRVYLVKSCPDHGEFRSLIWKGEPPMDEWVNHRTPSTPLVSHKRAEKGCPHDCGLCPEHQQRPCCVLLEITSRCDLKCPVCFASSGEAHPEDPTLQEIEEWYRMLMASGGPFNIQLSGGEPTQREDLPEIIALGKSLGFEFIQLNTNGLKLSREPGYAKTLMDAGLNCVFLQFDGLDDDVFRALRGREMLQQKLCAIDNCSEAGLGIVLVPTLVPGVNMDQLGELVRFAAERMPSVRGVHFQPISYFGRYPEDPPVERITIPEILRALQVQTLGAMKVEDFIPPGGEHARCSFHGNFLVLEDGRLKALTTKGQTKACCCTVTAAETSRKARLAVARQWSPAGRPIVKARVKVKACDPLAPDTTSLDQYLERAGAYTLAISGMLFQDAWTLDLQRLKECIVHVVSRDGGMIPFCAYNLTGRDGRSLHR